MTHVKLGSFQLRFEPGGKLAELLVPGGVSILHPASFRMPLGPDRIFDVGGWDECFPRIEPDMGELISAGPGIRELPDRVEQIWPSAKYEVTRTFRARGDKKLELQFRAKNTGPVPLPFLWASHALFSFDWIKRVTFAQRMSTADFSINGTCGKFFVEVAGPARIEGDGLTIILETDQPYWGVWLNRGGWPPNSPAPFRCMGIEATTTAAEAPRDRVLQPGQEFNGWMSLEVE